MPIYFVVLFILFLVCGLLVLDARVTFSTNPYCYDDIENLPQASSGLILGTSSRLKNGRSNRYYKYRIQAGIEVYNSGKVRSLIVSGHAERPESGSSYNEAEEMKRDLMAAGIPGEHITQDSAGSRTINSIRNTIDTGTPSVIIISQRFHNQRALYLAGKLGLEATGYNARDVSRKAGAKTRTREIFARFRMFIDLLLPKKTPGTRSSGGK